LARVLVVLGLLFHSLLPIAHPPARGSSAVDIPDWIMATLCLGDASLGTEDGTPPAKCPACPICLAAQLASVLYPPPATTGLVLPASMPVAMRWDRQRTAGRSLAQERPHSRGPPRET